MDFVICVHGGAGTIDKAVQDPNAPAAVPGEEQARSLRRIISQCYQFALANMNNDSIGALDIVEYAAVLLENDPLFNAGWGAVYNTEGKHELEAAIMDGNTRKSGAACYLKTIKNPIKLARKVMSTPHCMLTGEAAAAYGAAHGCEVVNNNYFGTKRRRFQLKTVKAEARAGGSGAVQNSEDTSVQFDDDADELSAEEEAALHGQQETNQRTGTIGCVAMYKGNVAAATSTGGMTNKFAGRLGDSSIIGCGTIADNRSCAVSCTGVGELFIKETVASTISHRMRFAGESLESAVKNTVFVDLPMDSGGVIAVDKAGSVSMLYNTKGMYRAQCSHPVGGRGAGENNCMVAIWEEEIHFTA
jgi:L-asparaginase / beta-aspartyl-peptidase